MSDMEAWLIQRQMCNTVLNSAHAIVRVTGINVRMIDIGGRGVC